MNTPPEWDPRAPEVLADPIAAYDDMRHKCPVAHSDFLHWSVFRHADVVRIAQDPTTFSSHAARYVSVPNTMDPPEHAAWRRMIEPYFDAARMQEFAPQCRRISEELVAALARNEPLEVMFALAHPFALRMQSAFLGWPNWVQGPLLEWIHRKNAATLSADRDAITRAATEFDGTIRALLKERRAAGDRAPADATTRLLHETVNGEPVADEAIVSILRNWTVGELGTMASSAGIIAHYLATHPDLQEALRQHPAQIGPANDEILRIHAPLIANRRTPTCPVQVGGTDIPAGERITLMWASANRDEAVFGNPDEFRLDRDPSLNLLYGTGIHACPGAPLARLELDTLIATLLASGVRLETVPGVAPQPAIYPASGFRQVTLLLRSA